MYIYLICFCLSCLFLYFSDLKKYKNYKKIFVIIGLLLPCILAGCRSLKIGSDVEIYLKPLFLQATNSNNIIEYLSSELLNTGRYELGFTTYVYIFTNIFRNIHFVLFFIEAIIIIVLYYSIINLKETYSKISLWFSFLIYYLLFYNIGLNIMRQFIGISFGLLSMSLIIKSKRFDFKSLIWIFIGAFFHKSTLIFLVPYFVYLIFDYINNHSEDKIILNKKINKDLFCLLLIIVVSIVLVLFVFLLPQLLPITDKIHFLSRLSSFVAKKMNFKFFAIRSIPIIILFAINYKRFIKYNKDCWFYVFIFIINYWVLNIMSASATFGNRFSYSFEIFNIIYLQLLCNAPFLKSNRKVLKYIIIIYLIILWWYNFVYLGYHQTVPFMWF